MKKGKSKHKQKRQVGDKLRERASFGDETALDDAQVPLMGKKGKKRREVSE